MAKLVGDALKKEIFDDYDSDIADLKSDVLALQAGGSRIEIFNSDVGIGSFGATFTGMVYFEAMQDMSVIEVAIQIFEKGSISSGTLSVDIKKNSTPNDTGMTSIFTTLPSINFATATDYQRSTGTLGSASVLTKGQILRLDITSLPVGLGRFRIVAIGSV